MASAAHAHVMPIRNYVLVWFVLIIMTILTAAVSFFELPHMFWNIVVALVIATFKATLVVLLFMHAIASSRLTWIVISFAVVWLGILFLLTLTDYLSRGIVPSMPGH